MVPFRRATLAGVSRARSSVHHRRAPPDRLLNPHRRRHFRRRWSTSEPRAGVVIVVLLLGMAAWVAWKGQHLDPARVAEATLLDAGDRAVDRGPLPAGLAVEGYREGPLKAFDPQHLFEKINGRADFFKARGFVSLRAATLAHEQPEATIDLEVYDMGSPDGARGTWLAEKAPGVEGYAEGGSSFHREENALFLARGPYYVRAVAASGGADVDRQLAALRTSLEASIAGAEAPWSHEVFVGGMGLDASKVGFVEENAFSFGFAKELHVVLLDDGETEVWITATEAPDAAASLADEFLEGFAQYGDRSDIDGIPWVVDRYIGGHSTAVAVGARVAGVKAAPTVEGARTQLDRLLAAVGAASPPPVESQDE